MNYREILAKSFPFNLSETYDFDEQQDEQIFLYDLASTSILNLCRTLKEKNDFVQMIDYLQKNIVNLDPYLLSKIEYQTNIVWSDNEESLGELHLAFKIILVGLKFIQTQLNKQEAVESFFKKLYSHQVNY